MGTNGVKWGCAVLLIFEEGVPRKLDRDKLPYEDTKFCGSYGGHRLPLPIYLSLMSIRF